MKRATTFFAFLCLLLLSNASLLKAQEPANGQASSAGGDQFVWADFEDTQNKRPVSKHGGMVQIVSYQETTPSKFKGMADTSPPAPDFVKFKPDDPNHAIGFDYELYAPNQYAGVGVEVHGQPDKDGKSVADDLSAYKFLTMQVYATGVQALRVEIMSRGQGINLTAGFPQMTFKIKPGLNTYKIPLGSLSQPSWQQTRVGAKDILKKLTAVSVTAYCEGQCAPIHGTVVLDNMMFQK